MFQNELDERVTRSLPASFQDGMALRTPEFQEAFEMTCRAEMRTSLSLIGITQLKGFCTVNETDVERLAAYTSRINTAKVVVAPRQPTQPATRFAVGNETVPAKPATSVISVIERLASTPRIRVTNAKQGS